MRKNQVMPTNTLEQTRPTTNSFSTQNFGNNLNDRLQSISNRAADLSSDRVTKNTETQRIARVGNEATDSSRTVNTGNQTIARTSPAATKLILSIPVKGPWSTALYNVDTQTLTVTRYQNGLQVGSPVTVYGTFTGGGNNISTENVSGGSITRGSYDIREMKGSERTTDESKGYRARYPNTKRDWLVLDAKDSKPGDDINQANGRSGLRLHIGRGSAGCVTVPAAQESDWQRVEMAIPKGKPGQIVGRMEIIGGDRASTNMGTDSSTMASTETSNSDNTVLSAATSRDAGAEQRQM
jgi:hypothetical protein